MSRPVPEGKVGKFFFTTRKPIEGRIVYTPRATGDCWIVECWLGGHVYIQNFDYMFLTPEPPGDSDD